MISMKFEQFSSLNFLCYFSLDGLGVEPLIIKVLRMDIAVGAT
tara:strand:- start:794 stop:922 length:129 start_codon:yes stop_codon:yes gene_type:complete